MPPSLFSSPHPFPLTLTSKPGENSTYDWGRHLGSVYFIFSSPLDIHDREFYEL